MVNDLGPANRGAGTCKRGHFSRVRVTGRKVNNKSEECMEGRVEWSGVGQGRIGVSERGKAGQAAPKAALTRYHWWLGK